MAQTNVPVKLIFFRQNTQIIEVDGLKNQTGVYFNNATVTATLVDQNGAQVPGFVNITLTYVAASSGVYQGTVTSSFNPPVGVQYRCQLSATQGGATGYWVLLVEVDDRRM